MESLNITDEVIDKLADKIASKINISTEKLLNYGEVARRKGCSIHFSIDENHRDEFLIKDDNGCIIGMFKEVVECRDCAFRRRSEHNLWCEIFDKIVPNNGFCNFGESKYD